MFGFKRKKGENELALIPRKESIFSKIAAFFRRDKQEVQETYYSNQSFYSRHSYVANSINNLGEEVFYGTVSADGLDVYSFQKMKEIGLMHHLDDKSTKLIVADLNQSYNQEGLEPHNLRKICFEIPEYYSLEEFLYNDGLYQLVQSGRVKLEDLNYYKINLVGKAEMRTGIAMQTAVTITDNTQEAISYVDKKLTNDWLNQIERDKKIQQRARKEESKQQIEDMYKQALIDEENFVKRETEEKQNRINDNNIRVAPGKKTIYFTDPDSGKIIFLDKIVRVKTIVHKDGQTSDLYIAQYTAKRKPDEVENLANKSNIAFELTEDEMNNILKNTDESLNFAFRGLFSERNVNQYRGTGELGSRHIGYLKRTIEGYKILLGSNSSRSYLNSLNLEMYNSNNKPNLGYIGYGDGR